MRHNALGITHIIGWTLPFVLLAGMSCKQSSKSPGFISVPVSQSSIGFENTLREDSVFNIIEYLYFYNGGGVAIGDVNNDGLLDLYFSGNQVSNKLYLNKGNFTFDDITARAGVSGVGNWKTGVSMVDVNADGYLDIFICGVGGYKKFNSRNQLLINNKDLTFTDRTREYGLDFMGLSTQVAFLDFDLDGDLDCYLLNHSVHSASTYVNVKQRYDGDTLSGDQFYRNDRIVSGQDRGKTWFTKITQQAGILSSRLGYGLGIGVSDVNTDGYPDIYISNDFHENDYLYLNNKQGGFRQILEKAVGHTSRFSMGNDLADINNDTRIDIVSLDMLPNEESAIKTSAGEDPYEIYKYKLSYGYHPQVSRNCLQWNRFVSDTAVFFSDIGMLSGIGATDWSWSPLLADFDNDGLKDLFISNGILRRPNDLDYINFISNQEVQNSLQEISASDLRILGMMPSGKVTNFFFKNSGNLQFKDVSRDWGATVPTISNGAGYGDLDNDGDLDLVINNLNEPAQVLQNTLPVGEQNSYLTIRLNGSGQNFFGLGTKIIAYAAGETLLQEAYYIRGFCSSVAPEIHMGLGNRALDSLVVIWPDFKYEVIKRPKVNTRLYIDYNNARGRFLYEATSRHPFLTPVTPGSIPEFQHQENDFNAFSEEGLIPHALTHEGPPLAVGDINGDGLDDVLIGGGKEQQSRIFQQTANGGWQDVTKNTFVGYESEVIDAAFFDADHDSDLDFVLVSGGQEAFDAQVLKPRLYLNDGKGSYHLSWNAFGKVVLNASCVKPMDFDQDGDIDLFIGASVMPQLYGMSPISFLLKNDGFGKFTPDLNWLGKSHFDNPTKVRPGMVKDAVWTKVNQDNWIDLILVGEWMPITVLIQQPDHTFLNQTDAVHLEESYGWWNTILASDFDRDGDEDWIVGNFGLNSRLKASSEKPVKMYLGDFDSNGGSDHILVYFNGEKSYPFASRDQLIKQIPSLKKKFLKYTDYRDVVLEDIVTPQQQGNSAVMKVNMLESVYLENNTGNVKLTPLPMEAQISPIFSSLAEDIDGDGNLDVLVAGNLLAAQPDLGPYDASYGLVLLGDGKGGWRSLSIEESGLLVSGEVRSIVKVKSNAGSNTYLFSRNNQTIAGFKSTKK